MKGKTDKPQIDKFRDLARQLETDDDEARFDANLRKAAKAPAKPKPAAKPAKDG